MLSTFLDPPSPTQSMYNLLVTHYWGPVSDTSQTKDQKMACSTGAKSVSHTGSGVRVRSRLRLKWALGKGQFSCASANNHIGQP